MLRALGVEQLLTVGKLFKQLVLGGAYQLTVFDTSFGVWKAFLRPRVVKRRLFARIDLAIIKFIYDTIHSVFLHVHTHYYSVIPVTERWIDIAGKDGRHKVKCSFLGSQNAGRLSAIIETGMRKKHRTIYDGFEPDDAGVRYFTIPAAEMAEKIDKRNRLLTKMMFWSLTVLFSWVLISMIIQEELEDNWLWLVLAIILNVLILGGVNLFICGRSKKSAQNIPYEIMFRGGTMYIDGEPFGDMDIERVVMTPEVGFAKGDMRRLVLYCRNGNTDRYDFGFRADRSGFPGYAQLVEAVKENFNDKFAYDVD